MGLQRKEWRWTAVAVILSGCRIGALEPVRENDRPPEITQVTAGNKGGEMSLMDALRKRRSIRRYGKRSLTEKEMMALLWAGQGESSDTGLRTAPSAGATYPLELHLVTAKGVSRYDPRRHSTSVLAADDRMSRLADAALGQSCVRTAGVNFVIGGVTARTATRYGDRAERYVIFEAGAAAENMLLMATALGLGAVVVGAYDDERVREISLLPKEAVPLAIVSVGPSEQ